MHAMRHGSFGELEQRTIPRKQPGRAVLYGQVDEHLVVWIPAHQPVIGGGLWQDMGELLPGRFECCPIGTPARRQAAGKESAVLFKHARAGDPSQAARLQRRPEPCHRCIAENQPVQDDVGVDDGECWLACCSRGFVGTQGSIRNVLIQELRVTTQVAGGAAREYTRRLSAQATELWRET